MAIVIEEERPRVRPTTIIGWMVILGIIVVSVYFIFFTPPDTVVEPVDPVLQNTQKISDINLDPARIIEHRNFGIPHIAPPVPGNLGRPNPFEPY